MTVHDAKLHLSADEVLAFLHAIDRGEVTVKVVGRSWNEVYAGNVEYEASNGWRLTVFNDCDDWDYIDLVKAPDGREMTWDYIFEHCREIKNWFPSRDVAAQFFGVR